MYSPCGREDGRAPIAMIDDYDDYNLLGILLIPQSISLRARPKGAKDKG